jgi:site-specific DNA recombinase
LPPRGKGKRCGGLPILGYDVDPQNGKLVVNEQEAERVRAIFRLYLRHETLPRVVAELARRGWANKRWRTRKGRERGGAPFIKSSLHHLLTNVTYVGKVRYKREVHGGEHASIVEEELWRSVQELLRRHGQTKGAGARNRHGALLKGLLYCAGCGQCMKPTHSRGKHTRVYRYYFCRHGQRGCPPGSLPALDVERLVVEQIQGAAAAVPGNEGEEANLAPVRVWFKECWPALEPQEQTWALRLLIERVDYDPGAGQMRIRQGMAHGVRAWSEKEVPAWPQS